MNSKFFSWLTNVQLSIPDSAQKTAIDKLPLSSQKNWSATLLNKFTPSFDEYIIILISNDYSG